MIDKIVKALTVILAIALLGYIIFLKMPGASVSSKESVAELSASELYTSYTQYALITLESSEKKTLDSYEIGQNISVKAICTGILMEVTLNKGVIQD